jgi:hypothetical protein
VASIATPPTVTATDNCDNDVDVVCMPLETEPFDGPTNGNPQTTTVTCVATDDANNQSRQYRHLLSETIAQHSTF